MAFVPAGRLLFLGPSRRLRGYAAGAVQLLAIAGVWLAVSLALGELDPLGSTAGVHRVAADTAALLTVEHYTGLQYVDQALRHVPVIAGQWLYLLPHFAGTFVFGLWLYRRHRPVWLLERWVLLAVVVLALVSFAVAPVAPPWMLGLGDGTPQLHGNVASAGIDMVAAYPSLHVAVAAWVAHAGRRAGASRLVWLYPVVVAVFVVASGNHYSIDALAAFALVAAAGRLVSPVRGGD
ncbi:MAG TPA: phosphatase PAP2 family protein [Mycobacteriales bacterium]|jgi:hypothetical protein|nr:phosphatase PAP2 family protein [Mycobacteriales bacterium]